MTPEQWQKVEAVLQEALDLPKHERAPFLDEACAGDEQLRDEATSLVNAYDDAGDFIEQPAIAQDARVLVADDINDRGGQEIGPYKVLSRLGAGGMGEVYLAEDTRLDRLVALKILPAYFASDDERLRRFQREARAASALNHPNILTIHEVGESAGIRYIATEFIDGATIRQLLAERELSLAEILDVAEQVCSALSAAHTAGIVHRDIKPENIMRRADGLVKILDFGIAKLLEPSTPADETQSELRTHTEAGLLLGTVNYMSPEQARGLPVDERSDVWSLGIVVYEMLAQRLPFNGATRMDTIVAILDRDPSPLSEAAKKSYDISPLLEQTIDRCLRKDMLVRLGSANELLAELKLVQEELNTGSSPRGSRIAIKIKENAAASKPQAASWTRHYFWPVLGLVLVLAVFVGTSLYRRNQRAVLPGTPATSGKLYLQMSEAEQLDFIDQQEQRISTMMGDRPVKLSSDALRAIKSFIDRYAARQGPAGNPGGESLSVIYGRGQQYVPLIARSFAARKVPIIVGIYLPMVESAYRNCYENSIGAKGLFQFLPQTAEQYGVPREDMCDVEKMTPAAAHYIADSMAELGEDSQSMTLVLLSYNQGANLVRDNLRQLRGTENYERNFWTLLAHRDQLDDNFRNEGANYVPSFFAAAIIGENPKNFELLEPPLSKLAERSQQ
ncbi:MAG TPA: serine/threonine-protein kinase [Pyrinomonadaceae bacterium]|jgi:serine/threonine protein kinase|nr:serine/threonine-protein kinase [Pyrinomonadaceae bacterium]